jgi:predicted nucleotidyltransferase
VSGSHDVAARLRELLADAPGHVVSAYLFGSTARGTAGTRSDVDVAILLAAPPPSTLEGHLFDYEARIEAALRRPVQFLVLNTAPADLVHRVLRDGEILLDRDRAARIRFEVKARNEFFDLAPIRKEYRQPRRRPA